MVALAQAQAFSFEGFALGMPRAKAMELKTDAPWRLAAVEGQGDVIRKEFAARQHDRPDDNAQHHQQPRLCAAGHAHGHAHWRRERVHRG